MTAMSAERLVGKCCQVLTDAPIPTPILPPDLTVREVCEGNDSRQRLLFSFAPLTLVQLATVHGMVCCEIPLLRVWWKSQIDHKRQAEPFGFGSKHGRNRPSSSNRSCCLPTERTRDMS